ncbi:hypothetical protein EAF04_003829 [Stromatinia cepivora]|nr:hypothetical protein EAF04_003829 [Stromatinia cepivora]
MSLSDVKSLSLSDPASVSSINGANLGVTDSRSTLSIKLLVSVYVFWTIHDLQSPVTRCCKTISSALSVCGNDTVLVELLNESKLRINMISVRIDRLSLVNLLKQKRLLPEGARRPEEPVAMDLRDNSE